MEVWVLVYKKLIIGVLVTLTLFCTPKEKHPTKQDWAIAILASHYNFTDECLVEYGNLSAIFQTYVSEFASYSSNCENAIIGDSTMDLGRQAPGFYDPLKTNNYGVSGNTACDFLYQMEFIHCNPKNVIIATADGNGILRGIAPSISIKTISKVIARSKAKWDAKVILIGVHPIEVTRANEVKNEVNEGVKSLPDCYINPLPIFGVGPNDPPPPAYMADSIHYKEPIYSRYKNQIQIQCGVWL